MAITTRLMGGLGNQMFQYALGRFLSLKHGVPLKLDLEFLRGPLPGGTTQRRYALDPFHIQAEFASAEEVAAARPRSRRRAARWLEAITPISRRGYLLERSADFDPTVLRAGPGAYLEGYWQSAAYFADVAEQLRQDFILRSPATGANQRLLDEIGRTASVALHVRRGDYLSNPAAAAVHGVCGLDYYQVAIRRIAERVRRPHFFVFSDEPDWVRANLDPGHPTTFVVHNGEAPHEDIRLMAACRHFVIANSSFSWWGGWLSQAPEKIVIAPRRWALDAALNVESRFPPDWIRL